VRIHNSRPPTTSSFHVRCRPERPRETAFFPNPLASMGPWTRLRSWCEFAEGSLATTRRPANAPEPLRVVPSVEGSTRPRCQARPMAKEASLAHFHPRPPLLESAGLASKTARGLRAPFGTGALAVLVEAPARALGPFLGRALQTKVLVPYYLSTIHAPSSGSYWLQCRSLPD